MFGLINIVAGVALVIAAFPNLYRTKRRRRRGRSPDKKLWRALLLLTAAFLLFLGGRLLYLTN